MDARLRRLVSLFPVVVLALAGCSRSVPTSALEASVVRGQAEDGKGEASSFSLPEDEGGQLLRRVLPPAERPGLLHEPTPARKPLPPPPALGATMPPLPALEPSALRLPPGKAPGLLRPHLITEEILDGGLDPLVPQRPSFEPGERIRVASPEVQIPPPLPILAQPVPDRVPVEDVTTESSTAAVLAAPLPDRTLAAPFVRVAVPDPFENRKPIPKPASSEEPGPQAATPLVGRP